MLQLLRKDSRYQGNNLKCMYFSSQKVRKCSTLVLSTFRISLRAVGSSTTSSLSKPACTQFKGLVLHMENPIFDGRCEVAQFVVLSYSLYWVVLSRIPIIPVISVGPIHLGQVS